MMNIPVDCGHAFRTLVEDTEVFYMVSAVYVPESERACRWNDPAFEIEWPDVGVRVIIERDQQYPDCTL